MTILVSDVLEKFGAEKGLNVEARNIDDVCFGFNVTSDKTARQVFQEHSAIYNYQIVDGDPILLVRRKVNDDLIIDLEINEEDCIRRGQSPAVTFTRIDPASLPLQVEVQHGDPARDYAMSAQTARHIAAPQSNTKISVTIDFIISAQQARDLAFDLLYRIWAQQLAIGFEHPDMRIEPGDIIRLITGRGIFVCLVTNNALNFPARTNTISAVILLTSKGAAITAPTSDPFVPHSARFAMVGLSTASFVGAGASVLTTSGTATVSFTSNGDDDAFLLLIE